MQLQTFFLYIGINNWIFCANKGCKHIVTNVFALTFRGCNNSYRGHWILLLQQQWPDNDTVKFITEHLKRSSTLSKQKNIILSSKSTALHKVVYAKE